MGAESATATARPLAAIDGLELAIPECAKGLGSVISRPDSAELIEGVRVMPFPVFPDDRGFFLEVQRFGRGLVEKFPAQTSQISFAANFPGTIKAFHFHLHQTDCWTPAKGMLQVVLVDLRIASPTFGRRNTMYVGDLRPWHVLIPPGVGHGYKVIGPGDAMLVYMTDRFYNPQDEGRVAYNDASINYDWETQRK
jgi:dTDP-4-dehydrorhamnose 3,5-epimerase